MKLVYPIILYPMEEHEGGYTVEVPDLPGCFSAGDTLEDAMIQAEEAITGWIEAAIDDGQDIPAPSILNHCAPPIQSLRAGCGLW